MPRVRYLRSSAAPGALAADFARIREELHVAVDFPAEVEAEAEAAARGPTEAPREDLRDVPFFTVDPPGSRDLDQAMRLERDGAGYLVRYAIADVGAFVAPGGALEAEAWRRGVTVYCPDLRATLYPAALCEGAASLLPGQDRPAFVFTIAVGRDGEVGEGTLRRAWVRSRAQCTYADVDEPLLAELGRVLAARARERGAVQIEAPAQVVAGDERDGYELRWEAREPSEDWNAQISLLAGGVAARLMLELGVGLFRTQEGAVPGRVARLRLAARALGVDWPEGEEYDDFVMSLHAADPRHAALLEQARGVMGNAGYTFYRHGDGRAPWHASVAGAYAHATAPLRRLADRYVLELVAGRRDGADEEALRRLPGVMHDAERRAGAVERAVVDDLEARELEGRVGERFHALVLEQEERGARIQIAEPPVQGRVRAPGAAPGADIVVRLERADPVSRSLQFSPG